MNDQTKHDGQAAMPPVAWVRYCSDGRIEGPILDSDSRMDGIRREFWTPLFAALQSASAQPTTVPDGWPNELLDWVSACQSAYHIDSTPGHRFGGLGSNLEENRAAVVEHVASLLAAATDKQRQAHLAERHAYLQERAKCEQLEARIADLELAIFAENQKRQEVEQQRGQLLSALELVLCDTEEAEYMTGRERTENARAVIAAVRGETLCTPTSPS